MMKRIKGTVTLFALPEGEKIVSMVEYHDTIIFCTERCIYRITDADDDTKVKVEIMEVVVR